MRTTATTGLAGLLTVILACGSTAFAGSLNVTIDVASTFPGKMPILGDTMRQLPEKIARASGGELVLKFHEPGVIVPGAETVNAVSQGKVAAAWAGAGGRPRRGDN
jgi:TRAP-type mannitol/chloroaromatic compound transport system substrate-binding protein